MTALESGVLLLDAAGVGFVAEAEGGLYDTRERNVGRSPGCDLNNRRYFPAADRKSALPRKRDI